MDKFLSYYLNRKKYEGVCIPKRLNILNYLIKEKFLSEFVTEEEKVKVLLNLGILQRLDNLLYIINLTNETLQTQYTTKEEFERNILVLLNFLRLLNTSLQNYVTNQEFARGMSNIETTVNKLSDSLLNYVTESRFLREIAELKSRDERSKGYFSSYELLVDTYPVSSDGDWAIVDVDGIWYIFRYEESRWKQTDKTFDIDIRLSEYAKITDLEDYVKSTELTRYIKDTDLVDYVKKGDLGDYVKLSDLVQIFLDLGLENYVTLNLLSTLLANYLSLLVSGINIKTINGESILGSGNIEIIGTGGDSDKYLTKEEFYNILNPLKINVSVSPTLLEYTGNSYNINLSFIAKKGNSNIVPDSSILTYKNVEQSIEGPVTISVQDKGTTTFTVTCNYKSETTSGSASVNLVLPTYIGFSSEEISSNVDLASLLKKILSNISMTETLQNSVAGTYLWIISPYTLNKVATDLGFTYEVKMVESESLTGLHCYRSNSKIDISNLTYYIK